jgi:hypothetical protein
MAAPQLPQNRVPDAFDAPQLVQFMPYSALPVREGTE